MHARWCTMCVVVFGSIRTCVSECVCVNDVYCSSPFAISSNSFTVEIRSKPENPMNSVCCFGSEIFLVLVPYVTAVKAIVLCCATQMCTKTREKRENDFHWRHQRTPHEVSAETNQHHQHHQHHYISTPPNWSTGWRVMKKRRRRHCFVSFCIWFLVHSLTPSVSQSVSWWSTPESPRCRERLQYYTASHAACMPDKSKWNLWQNCLLLLVVAVFAVVVQLQSVQHGRNLSIPWMSRTCVR